MYYNKEYRSNSIVLYIIITKYILNAYIYIHPICVYTLFTYLIILKSLKSYNIQIIININIYITKKKSYII